MVIDGGLPTAHLEQFLASSGNLIDFVKIGWGTALVTQDLDRKIQLLDSARIDYYFGGTLFEKFAQRADVDEYIAFCESWSCRFVEVSNGTLEMSNTEKARHIERLSRHFAVISEVGFKDSTRAELMGPTEWAAAIHQDLDAGARYVITEARESGRSGLCSLDGKVRGDVLDEVLASGVNPADLIFEAPNKELQVYFVRGFGSAVNVGNVAPGDVIALETLRLGLRSDTFDI
jgi:phosphosulfolactate synthase